MLRSKSRPLAEQGQWTSLGAAGSDARSGIFGCFPAMWGSVAGQDGGPLLPGLIQVCL